jgi:GntR family histidine utilization transcriptional repressor
MRRDSFREVTPGPKYEEIKRYVRTRIRSGEWKVSERIPSENELAVLLEASRLTVHRALRELGRDGVITRVHGVGSFVAPPKSTSPMIRIQNIADDIRERGQSFSTTVLRLKRIRAPSDLALALEVEAGAPVYHSLIIYNADGVPAQMEDRYVLPWFAPNYLKQDFSERSTTDYLQSIAVATVAEHAIEAINPDSATQRLLRVSKKDPCLMVTRKTWVGVRVTTFTRFIYPGPRHKIFSRITTSHID